jgi:[ribosomal protein S18]-alanine N-acetyltransferase
MARVTFIPSEPRIRAMAAADLPQVAAIERDSFGAEAWPAQAFRDLVAAFGKARPSRGSIWVAEEPATHEILGYAGVEVSALCGEMDIINIAVAAPHRRRGIGRAFLDRIVTHCREVHVPLLWLRVRASNLGAQAFYRRLGFEPRGQFDAYYLDPDEPAIIMAMDVQ